MCEFQKVESARALLDKGEASREFVFLVQGCVSWLFERGETKREPTNAVEQQKVQKGPVAGGLASGVHGQKPVVDHHKVEEREHGLSKGVEIGDDIVARYEGERGQ